MKKTVIILILSCVLLSGCIEIVEEITINKDQSGKVEYRIETNLMGSLINNLTDLMDINLENQMKSEVEKLSGKLRREKGITNVTINTKGNLTDYTFEFEFSSASDLNTAFYNLFGLKENLFSPKYLKLDNHHFKRMNFAPWIKKYLEKEGIELPQEELTAMVFYKTVIHFPREVIKFRGDGLQLINDRKTLFQKHSLSAILGNKADVGIKTRY